MPELLQIGAAAADTRTALKMLAPRAGTTGSATEGGAPGMNGDLRIYPKPGYWLRCWRTSPPPEARRISEYLDPTPHTAIAPCCATRRTTEALCGSQPMTPCRLRDAEPMANDSSRDERKLMPGSAPPPAWPGSGRAPALHEQSARARVRRAGRGARRLCGRYPKRAQGLPTASPRTGWIARPAPRAASAAARRAGHAPRRRAHPDQADRGWRRPAARRTLQGTGRRVPVPALPYADRIPHPASARLPDPRRP